MGFQSSRNVPEKLSNLITQSGSTILWAPYGRVISQFLEVVPKMAAGRKAGEVWAPKVKRFYVFWGNNLQSAHAASSATIDSAAGLVTRNVNQPLREPLLDSTIYTGLEVNLPWKSWTRPRSRWFRKCLLGGGSFSGEQLKNPQMFRWLRPSTIYVFRQALFKWSFALCSSILIIKAGRNFSSCHKILHQCMRIGCCIIKRRRCAGKPMAWLKRIFIVLVIHF